MKKPSIRNAARRSALSLALGMCLASGAHAQSNTAGSIFGSGVEPGTTITVESTDTGLRRQVVADGSGRFSLSSLPVGRYRVTAARGGEVVGTRSDVSVVIGGGAEVSFAAGATAEATTLDGVQVIGNRGPSIDVSATDTRTVFTAEKLANLPVARNIQSVALLAPGVIQADSRYPNTASFGGSAASENAFYINGYAVTNPLTNLGSTTLPFDAINQMQVITGGYGAEFGRATGGVVNIVTNRGGNEWKIGGLLTYSPSGLRADSENIYYPQNGTPTDGLVYQKRDEIEVGSWSYAVHAGGPLIRDRLFVYASGELTQQDQVGVLARPGGLTNGYQRSEYNIPRWMAKVDWQIADDHALELTAVSDVTKQNVQYSQFQYVPGTDDIIRGSSKTGGYFYRDGGELFIGRYTGYLTDDLTLTALYGQQKSDHEAVPFGYDPGVTYVSDSRSVANPVQRGSYAQLAFPDAYDETEGGRLDLEWQAGAHLFRLGYDRQDSESRAGEVTSGPGYRWIYNSCGPGREGDGIDGGGGATCPGGSGDYVSQYRYANGGTFTVEQYAYYLEDRWQVADNWLLSLGLRNENFENFNADGVSYVKQTDQWAPRIGLSWDVHGDASLKIFANAGRYHLAMPNNVALRGAAGSLYTNEYFAFTGIDPATGEPLGLTALGNGPYSSNREYGQAPDPRTVTAKGINPHFQDEFVLGFEQQFGDQFTYGARYVHRDLKSAIDDMCDFRPAYNWALGQGLSEETATSLGDALAACRLFNPGEGNTFLLDDGTGNLVEVPLTAAELGFPKLKRMYQGIDFFVERPFDGTWYGRVDYTLSRNYGNAEGQLKSDVGQGDVSQTMDWDHPELMEYANGYLPNDRRHKLTAYGYYQVAPDWRLSATASFISGRPRNCTGYYPDDPANDEFNELYSYGGPYYHYCNNEPQARGTGGRLSWTNRLDLGVAWVPSFADGKLALSMDVFNVFDDQTEQNIVEYGENGGVGVPYSQTGRVLSYSAPRNVRFAFRYSF